jgi:quercetin dioxygenase-like cupin family protein
MFFKKQVYLIYLVLFFISCKSDSSLPDPLVAGWKGESVCELLEDNTSQRILKCTFAPGVGHERHFHLPHFGYTLSGSTFRIKDTTGTREIKVETGSYFNSKGTKWHEVLNIGDRTAIFLIIEPK